jgi:hypothetical protein
MGQLATFSSSSYDPDRLIAGPSDELISRQITLITGQNLVRGALLGKTATAGTIAPRPPAGNTGNGAIGTLSVGAAAKEGRYRAVCIEPGANVGTFAVFDPEVSRSAPRSLPSPSWARSASPSPTARRTSSRATPSTSTCRR